MDKRTQMKPTGISHCHAPNLHSVLFDDTPGARVRCFVALAGHNLWKNSIGNELSVAIHSHHCDVRLEPIFGRAFNVSVIGAISGTKYSQFKYTSQINAGKGGFVRTLGDDHTLGVRLVQFEIKRPVQLKATDLHTVFVAYGEPAAWMVYEGAEDPSYDGMCYSNADLEKFDFSSLYKPMSENYVRWLLEDIIKRRSTRTRWAQVKQHIGVE